MSARRPDARVLDALDTLEDEPHAAGVTRLDLVCGAQVVHTAHELARRWGRDRALATQTVDRLASLVVAAVAHGLRYDPRSVTITLQWLDLERVRVDVRWRGCGTVAAPSPDDVDWTVGALDTLAEEWGFSTGRWGPVHWVVLRTG
jgi:hypothetical protein